METSTRDYLTCAETAKLVRAALKKNFPGQKFSVRSRTYAGGASIDVSYTDGPLAKDVERVAKRYQGGDFDGMIDLKYGHTHFLCADGTVYWRGTYGHSYENPESPMTLDDMPPGTRVVRFGADHIFVRRDFSPEREAEIRSEILKAAGREGEWDWNAELDVAVIDGEAVACMGQHHSERYASTLYHRLAATKDYSGD